MAILFPLLDAVKVMQQYHESLIHHSRNSILRNLGSFSFFNQKISSSSVVGSGFIA